MNKKISGIFVCMLLITAILPITGCVIAEDEQDPNIVDEKDDIFGIFIKNPKILNFFTKLKIFNMESFDFMDITSAWFYEYETEPDYLYASIKINDLEFTSLRVIYAIRWTYNEKNYAVSCHTHSNGEFSWFSAGRVFGLLDNWAYKMGLICDISDCKIGIEENIVTFKIPKDLVGDPESGDALTYTNAWTGLRFIFEPLTFPFGGEVAEDSTEYGGDYFIQY